METESINQRSWLLGMDIGGTFTDAVAVNRVDGEHRAAKVRTRSREPLTSIVQVLEALSLDWDIVEKLVLGTTAVTNAIVENDLPPIALVATKGFSDVLEIGRQNRRFLYRLDLPPKAASRVSDDLRLEVLERVDADGRVRVTLDSESVQAVRNRIQESGIKSIAVTLLHSYMNPQHELMVEAALEDLVDYIALSHKINPEQREFERTSTTVLSAAVMHGVSRYLEEIESGLPRELAFFLFHSAGGLVSSARARERPLCLALSGPSAGVQAASRVAAEIGAFKALTLDMGGTTTDVSLIIDGHPSVARNAVISSHQLRQPMVKVASIGAGGGSIAYFDRGALRVGPRSAGADPGPACFGLGGAQPTVTDANLLLGYLQPDVKLGGTISLSRDLAEAAILPLAEKLGLGLMETALGIVRVANSSMTRAVRNITVERGVDCRDCCLISFGGAGPMHAVQLAKDIDIKTVVVPRFSSSFSALGCVTANPSMTHQQTLRMFSADWDDEAFSRTRQNVMKEVLEGLSGARNRNAVEPLIDEWLFIKYVGQSYSVEVPYVHPANPDRVAKAFKRRHEELYGFATEEPWQVETIRIRATLATHVPRLMTAESRLVADPVPVSTEVCWFSATDGTSTRRYQRDTLVAGARLEGPAIVFDQWSTVVLPPGTRLSVDGHRNLVIRLWSE